jgi:cell division protein FtsB
MTSVPNLASRPFRNERLPSTLFGAAFVLLLVFTARHALELRRLPARSTSLHREVASLEAESSRLREEARRLRGPKPDAATVAQWALLKDLIDKRAFSWTRLLGRLESVLPDGVRLVAIDPSVKKGEMRVELSAVCRTAQDSLTLVKVLEASDEFEDVYPVSDTGGEGGESKYTMRYRPLELPPFVKPAESGAGGTSSSGPDAAVQGDSSQGPAAGAANSTAGASRADRSGTAGAAADKAGQP